MRIPLTTGAILLCALVAVPAVVAGPKGDYQAVRADYQQDGDITACDFTRQQLQNAKDNTPSDVQQYEPNFTAEMNAEIQRHDSGGCDNGYLVATKLVRPGVTSRQTGGRIKVRVTGRIVMGAGECNGKVVVEVRSGGRRRGLKRVRINSACRYATSLAFRVRSLSRGLRPRRRALLVRVNTRYTGTSQRRADRAPSRLARVRR